MLEAELAKARAAGSGGGMDISSMKSQLEALGMKVGVPGESDFTDEEIAMVMGDGPEQKQARMDALTAEGKKYKRQAKTWGAIADIGDYQDKMWGAIKSGQLSTPMQGLTNVGKSIYKKASPKVKSKAQGVYNTIKKKVRR
jgi:hypothetical protein